MTSVTHAAVAIIQRQDGWVLLGQRPEGKSWAGWWEFPGGKIEAGETAAEALQRELHEELGITATAYTPWITRQFSYPERTVRLNFFKVHAWQNEPHGKENQQLSWQNPAALNVSPLLPANVPVMQALCMPPIYAITNLAEMGEKAFFNALERALKNGLRWIQVREKQLSTDVLLTFTQRVITIAHAFNAKVILNGDVSLALQSGADGVHLSSTMLKRCTDKVNGLLYGASCHNAAELALAAEMGVDYALLSPVQATQSHPEAQPLGWEAFASLIRGQPFPVYALGGMTVGDIALAQQAGAQGIAMQRALWQV